jgi:hypothetical protein
LIRLSLDKALKQPSPPKSAAGVELPKTLLPFKAALDEWLAYKREKGQTYKPRGLKALYADCLKLGAGLPAAIQNSMAKNYAGIYAANGSQTYTGHVQPGDPSTPLTAEEKAAKAEYDAQKAQEGK